MAVPIAHFSHPQHELKRRESYHLPRSCDLCGDKITGSGYSCHWRLCDFNLHEECTRYPETLRSFFAHPWHDLTLSSRTDDNNDGGGGGRRRRVCDLCREEVPRSSGMFLYRCALCGFAMHPRCSRTPQTARSEEVHPKHGLTALPRAGTCAACREPCGVWVYRCGLCDVDLHIECLHGARPSSSSAGGKNDDVDVDLHVHGQHGAGSSSGEKNGKEGWSSALGQVALAVDVVSAVTGVAQMFMDVANDNS